MEAAGRLILLRRGVKKRKGRSTAAYPSVGDRRVGEEEEGPQEQEGMSCSAGLQWRGGND